MSQEEPRHIPIASQTLLTYLEYMDQASQEPINGAVHLMLMVSIAQAIAVVEVDKEAEGSVAYFLDRVEGWLEHLMEQVPSMPEQARVREEYRGLRRSAEEWLRHYQARDVGTTDTE